MGVYVSCRLEAVDTDRSEPVSAHVSVEMRDN